MSKSRILVVEDTPSISEVMKIKFAASGFEVEVVTDGEQALESLQAGQFDLVLLDLIMPKLDGFGVLAELKKRKDKTPVIVMSNLDREEDKAKAKKLGAKDYFLKVDLSLAQMVERINAVLKA